MKQERRQARDDGCSHDPDKREYVGKVLRRDKMAGIFHCTAKDLRMDWLGMGRGRRKSLGPS